MRIQLDTISDFARRGYKVRITCKSCGRMMDWAADRFMIECHRKRWPQQISQIEHRLKCGWCRERNATISPVEPPQT